MPISYAIWAKNRHPARGMPQKANASDALGLPSTRAAIRIRTPAIARVGPKYAAVASNLFAVPVRSVGGLVVTCCFPSRSGGPLQCIVFDISPVLPQPRRRFPRPNCPIRRTPSITTDTPARPRPQGEIRRDNVAARRASGRRGIASRSLTAPAKSLPGLQPGRPTAPSAQVAEDAERCTGVGDTRGTRDAERCGSELRTSPATAPLPATRKRPSALPGTARRSPAECGPAGACRGSAW